MKNKNSNENINENKVRESAKGKLPKGRESGTEAAIPGINTPGIELPAFNPPVPNRAWTAMRMGVDIDALSEEEKRELYYGKDEIL